MIIYFKQEVLYDLHSRQKVHQRQVGSLFTFKNYSVLVGISYVSPNRKMVKKTCAMVSRKNSFFYFTTKELKLSEFLRQSLMIFIIKGFRTIVFIFIVISTTIRFC